MRLAKSLLRNTNNRTVGLEYGASGNIRQKFTGYQKDDETAGLR